MGTLGDLVNPRPGKPESGKFLFRRREYPCAGCFRVARTSQGSRGGICFSQPFTIHEYLRSPVPYTL